MKNRRILFKIVICNVFLMAVLLCVLLIAGQAGWKWKSQDDEMETAAEEFGGEDHKNIAAKEDHERTASSDPDENIEVSEEDAGLENEIAEQEERILELKNSDEMQKDTWIADKLASMTIEEKIAQLFMLSPEKLTGVSHVTAAGDVTKNAINAFPVGGLIYFASNIETPQQISEMTAKTQSYALDRIGVPMFLAVDEEGGYVTRIAKNSNFDVAAFPHADELGRSGDVAAAYEMGSVIGEYLKCYGFNLDFAPVADVLSNPENQVVKKRSFGSDAQLVSDMALAELDGLESKSIIGCVKHFPGHGATAGDTHEGYAYTEKTWRELLTCDIIPFSNSIKKGVSMIMAGHISLPNVTGDDTPASMSYCMITEHLRNELGYNGIVITDSLGMGAITDTYDSKQVAVSVLKAGGDMILNPPDVKSAYEGILSEVTSGDISEERLDESVYRILNVKYELLKSNHTAG